MADSIFGERFLGRREPAWHGKGQVFDAPIGALEAIEAAGLGFRIEKHPLTAAVAGFGTVDVPRFALLREPTPDDPTYHFCGVCGKDYTVVQNVDVGKAIDPLTEKWPVETVAALEGGKTMLITLDAGGADVAGEAVHQYFLVTDTKDGGTSLRIAFTPVRVVCQNTLVTGLRSAMVQCNLQHRQSVSAELDLRVYLVGKMQEAQNSVMADFNSLAKAILSQDEVEAVMAAAYPYPKRSAKATLADELFAGAVDLSAYGDTKDELEDAVRGYGNVTARMDALRAGAGELLVKYNDEQPALANTAWSAYNAVVEVEDYRNGKGDVGYSALWGGRAKHKTDAFSIALRIAKAQGK